MLEKIGKDWPKKLALLVLVLIVPQTYALFQNVALIGLIEVTKWFNFDLFDYFQDRPLMLDAIFCVMWFSIYAIWYYFFINRKNKPVQTINKEPISIVVILQSIVVILGFGGITGLWMEFVKNHLAESDLFGLYTSYKEFSSSVSLENESYIWAFISLVLLGPIIEELLFRGIQYHYSEKICGLWFPIIITGLSFGIWHGQPVQVVYASLMGLMLGIIYHYTRNLWLLMFIHVLNNFLAALPPGLNTKQAEVIISITGKVLIIPALIILFIMIKKILNREKESKNLVPLSESIETTK